MEEVIDKYIRRKKPFLIIKYGIVAFNGVTNNAYELVTLGTKKLQYFPIEQKIATESIEKYNLPLLHKVDSRNMIWGDEEFKVKFKEKGLGI
jgi:hypothetical protein